MIIKPEIKYIIDNTKKRANCVVIVPTFNWFELVKKFIDLIKLQTIVPDIIIVDNNSSDWTTEKIQNMAPEVIILIAKENYASSWWQYLWQKYAYEKWYEWIILSDYDAYPIDNNLIETLIKNAWENQTIDMINSAESNKPNYYVFHYWILHRKAIEKIWFVDYTFFVYWDDEDYYLRQNKWGIHRNKISCKYYHPMKTFMSAKFSYFITRNFLYIQIKYHNIISFLFFLLSFSLSNLILKYSWWYKFYFYFFILWLKDLFTNNFNKNIEIINSNLIDSFDIQNEKIDDFFTRYKLKNNVLFSIKEMMEWINIIEKYKVKNNINKRLFLKESVWKDTLVSSYFINSSTIIQSILFKKIVFIKNINTKENYIEFFEVSNKIYKTIFILFLFVLYLLPIIIYSILLVINYYIIYKKNKKSKIF